MSEAWLKRLERLEEMGYTNPSLLEFIHKQYEWKTLASRKRKYRYQKRLFDVTAALLLLVVLAPLFLIIMCAVKMETRGPLFFIQLRLGHFGVPFWIIKFRTMTEDPTAHKNVAPMVKLSQNDHRVTKVGRFLRSTSLDELPQLLNVLYGTMSLVGPRPVTLEESACVPNRFMNRFIAKPGMTGLWQANVDTHVDGKIKLRLDVYYLTRATFVYDFKLLVQTFFRLCLGIKKPRFERFKSARRSASDERKAA